MGSFDLITCMLGTLSHFGWDRKTDREDCLQMVLCRIHDLLLAQGVVIFGSWSEYACKQRKMLGIYGPVDCERLARWTPDYDELKLRLERAGLKTLRREQPEIRLDVIVCGRAEDKYPEFVSD